MKSHFLTRALSLLIAMTMLIALSACAGQTDAEPAASTAGTEAPVPASETSGEAAASPTTASEAPAAESDAVSEQKTVSYPIEGGYTLTMVQNLMNHAASVLGGQDYTAQLAYKTLAEKTGVNIAFTMIAETAYSEQLNLLIASQDYPDIFGQGVGSYDTNLSKAVEDDVVLDLNDLIADNAPDYYAILQGDQEFADQVYNSDGTLCKITTRNVGVQSQGLFIRSDWLTDLGLSAPATMDELTSVLEAFHTAYDSSMTLMVNVDLDDGLALAFDHANVGFSRQQLGFQQTEPNSGKVICAMASDGYINHLTMLRDLYARGVINEDFLNISKENGNFESTYYSDDCGVFQEGCEVADPSYAANATNPNWQVVAMKTPVYNGEATHMSSYTAHTTGLSYMCISTTCEHPDVALQFLNFGFSDAGKDLVAFGIEGETYNVNEDGSVAYTELLTGYKDGVRSAEWLYLCNGWMPTDQQERALNMKFSSEAVAAYQMWTEAVKNGDGSMTIPITVSLTSEERETAASKAADICTHFSEAAAKYIMGEIDEAGYHDAITQADSLGLAEVTEIYQTAYDRYLSEQA